MNVSAYKSLLDERDWYKAQAEAAMEELNAALAISVNAEDEVLAELAEAKRRIVVLEAERGPGIKPEPEIEVACDIDWD